MFFMKQNDYIKYLALFLVVVSKILYTLKPSGVYIHHYTFTNCISTYNTWKSADIMSIELSETKSNEIEK